LELTAEYGLDVDHMDMVTAFLNLKIDNDNIYMERLLGIDWFTLNGTTLNGSLSNGSALILRKALYRSILAPPLWHEDINVYLQSIGFKQSAKDPNLYLQPGVLLVQ
jgi:hypothetical protein